MIAPYFDFSTQAICVTMTIFFQFANQDPHLIRLGCIIVVYFSMIWRSESAKKAKALN
ncbi:hypothetical protein A359_03940 [secondary endosymbiont of Ctenarytaina eucalypti]|uniref:Uncharacterized protein n=1 Tax=secondary endosymbiont of Ctenarytaina eucalypti TaxID=1199245 RepID=J3TF85_9ENTR|nr:hypothetical protein A359_03940 [secondary endosymbiont of Ctenarytaina eucalypti]